MKTPPLPTLTTHDARLLHAFFHARCDIFLMAQNEHLPALDLLRWSQSPAVSAHIAALKQLAADSTELRTHQARLLALDKLEHIVKTSDDPQELRRAASTIYRGGHAMPHIRGTGRPPPSRKLDPDHPPKDYLPVAFRRKWGNNPGMRPGYKQPRPTAHDNFACSLPHPPPAGEVPRSRGGAAEGAPSTFRPLPTLREPKSERRAATSRTAARSARRARRGSSSGQRGDDP